MRLFFWCMFFTLAAVPLVHAQEANDLSRFSRAIGKHVSIVERSGLVREGVVETVTADEVVLRVASTPQRLAGNVIAQATLKRDNWRDGAIKGAIVGTVVGALGRYEAYRHPEGIHPNANLNGLFLLHVTGWTAVGWLIDAWSPNRETIYQAPTPVPSGTLQFSFRF